MTPAPEAAPATSPGRGAQGPIAAGTPWPGMGALLPLAKPVPDARRWMVVQSNLAFVPIIASTALVVSAAVHRVRSGAIRAQVEREALLAHNEAQARDLAAANRELVDVHDCLESALALIEPDLGRVVVARDFEAGQRMLCRPALLDEVFLELLSNALEAQPSGGRIELTSRFSGDEARFVVRDEGGGIAPEHLERVFEPGFTTKGRGVGVGLGLSTVRRIVEEHGGRVEVASAVGRGTTFTVILPRRA